MGRRKLASSADEEDSIFAEICEKIANSKQGIEHILKTDEKYPSLSVFFKWKREDPIKNKIYLQAKDVQGHVFADEVNRIAQELESLADQCDANFILAHTRRLVALQNSRTWQAKNFAPRQFGDSHTTAIEELMAKVNSMAENEINGKSSGN